MLCLIVTPRRNNSIIILFLLVMVDNGHRHVHTLVAGYAADKIVTQKHKMSISLKYF